MMDFPLLLKTYLIRTAKYFGKKEIVSVYPDETFRYTYADMYKRVCQLSHALDSLGLKKGDRVASIALNNHRHMELYFGVPCTGLVLHTVNFRLTQDHLVYILNHAEDRVIFVDDDFLFLVDAIKERLKTVKKIIVLSQSGNIPETGLKNVVSYDEWISGFPEDYDFPGDLDEKDPAIICYTSATTGDPKGVVYTQRSIILHFLTVGITMGITETDCLLHCVPMFHVNAWGAPHGATAIGCKQVLPGREMLNMEKVCSLITEEKVSFTAGVPTIWIMLNNFLEGGGAHDFSSLKTIVSGGSACPMALMKNLNEKFGFPIAQAYGMTETSPLALAAFPKSYMQGMSNDDIYSVRNSAGILATGLEMKIVRSDGKEITADGKDMGEILFRGPWIAGEYYLEPKRSKESFKDGWLHTGDIGTIDEEGYVRLVDRTKDMIKSGGEWISSVDLENTIMAHPEVMEAAVIGIPDEKWQEVPMACIVPMPGKNIKPEEIKSFLKDKVKAKFWIPETIALLEQIPKTSVGKFNKRELRQMFRDGKIP